MCCVKDFFGCGSTSNFSKVSGSLELPPDALPHTLGNAALPELGPTAELVGKYAEAGLPHHGLSNLLQTRPSGPLTSLTVGAPISPPSTLKQQTPAWALS